MMTIFYPIGDSLYVNLTNKCPCRCVFCVREEHETVGNNNSLWLDHDPSMEEIKADLERFNLDDYKEIVFCGFGEPMMRMDDLIETAKYIKSKADIKTRINTNGLGDLIHEKNTAECIKDCIDSVSISLNAPDKESYCRVTRPKFGEQSFEAMLKFAEECRDCGINIAFSVVDEITPEEIEKSKELAESLGVKLRVRHKR
ncbi:TIGR04100 family radical SAM protein [Peptacetobacter hiranonis]|uniref:Radical SAM domain protein n=1 Tax=Peptacetobacter hiranonis (strain DSM 13275 / JCM 10541 / KCTC 15199 / TO-931) TaxID=500633 RepID=B6FXG8_PEPHT|nr:TIGR04100 family radical SAM protein [Peptacetobacter hiranonis]EEA85785.1 radical SAM domain protein [Peptacetobacter hiranonis DSM 13275]QEK20603.1 7-carboxy-7-deazaguanine synthase [Peptacetobacter hiranonis]